jgi:dCMP deaminase
MSEMHDVFMKTAFLFAGESKCVSHHVGAVAVKDKRIIAVGYNGTPPGLPNCDEHFNGLHFDREEHYRWSKDNEIHAEMNVLSFSAKNDVNINGADLYVTISPCNDCLKNLTMAGIRIIYYLYLYDKVELNSELLKVISVKEVPGADEIKKFVEKNNLLFISSQNKK